jgi:hypothetical protein
VIVERRHRSRRLYGRVARRRRVRGGYLKTELSLASLTNRA